MLIVRTVFTAKPGQASKLAQVFKRTLGTKDNVRILTDCIGDFNTVVMETEVASLAEYEQYMAEYKSGKIKMDAEAAAEMKGYTEMWLTGKREVLEVLE